MMNGGRGNYPNSQGRSGDNHQNQWQGSQGRPEQAGPDGRRPGQGGGIVQYFGPRSHNVNLLFQQPGIYNVGVKFSANGNGSQEQGTANGWMPSSQAGQQNPFVQAAHNMASQTSPMNVDNVPKTPGVLSPNLMQFQ